jgi:isopentenyl-diphosphate delta-isomerase
MMPFESISQVSGPDLNKAQFSKTTTGFEDIFLISSAIPSLAFDDIDITTELFTKRLDMPLIISGMPLISKTDFKINLKLNELAKEFNLGFQLYIDLPTLNKLESKEIAQLKENRGDNLVFVNLLLDYFETESPVELAIKAIEATDGDCVSIYFSSVRNLVNDKTKKNFTYSYQALKELCEEIYYPVIAREMSTGISMEVVQKLEKIGIDGLDIGGAGGTSWVGLEHLQVKNKVYKELSKLFWDWGIPTATSLLETRWSTYLPIIASGGIRNGVDMAKALTLGASVCGICMPIYKLACKGQKYAKTYIEKLSLELKSTMFLVGAKCIEDLGKNDFVILGKTLEWIKQRNLDLEKYKTEKRIR